MINLFIQHDTLQMAMNKGLNVFGHVPPPPPYILDKKLFNKNSQEKFLELKLK